MGLIKWFKEKVSSGTRKIILVLILAFAVGGGIAAYKINDFFENNPNACTLCHVHDKAQQAWQKSKHFGLNCHQCHHSSKREQAEQAFKFTFLGQKSVSPRHGKVIVPWKLCANCHWERNQKYPNAPLINKSRFHARHMFMEQIECSKCHGYIVHEFVPEARFCIKCHTNREIHGVGMEELPCFNCHTDRTKDLKPGRNKCLFCHGPESIRQELIAGGTIDVKKYQPSEETIKKAIKITVPSDAPMQFYCYECHKPHIKGKVRPSWDDCLRCHINTPTTGKHELHIKTAGMQCKDCHKQHIWRVTTEIAKKECTKCHEYREPKKFISPG